MGPGTTGSRGDDSGMERHPGEPQTDSAKRPHSVAVAKHRQTLGEGAAEWNNSALPRGSVENGRGLRACSTGGRVPRKSCEAQSFAGFEAFRKNHQ